MHFLIAYATTEGHTAEIAKWAAGWMERNGHSADLFDTRQSPDDGDLSGYDGFVLMGSLHLAKHQSSLVGFVHANLEILSKKPSAFVSASGTGSRRDPESLAKADACIDDFLKETSWTPTARTPIGGALLYTKYNFFIRLVMKKISEKEGGPTDTSRDFELTDWDYLASFLNSFITEHVSQRFTAAAS